MVTKTTKTKAPGAKFSVWRHYSPASVVSSDDNGAPPLSLLPQVLKTLGHDSIGNLVREIRKHERYALPKRLQSRIAKLFSVYTCASPSARSVALRDLDVSFGRKRRSIPYPFAICAPIKVTSLVIYDFTLSRDAKRGALEMQGRYGISTTPFLKARNQKSAKFCQLVVSGTLFESELSSQDCETVRSWLEANGFPKATALKAVNDEGFRSNLYFQIVERLEEFVGLQGAKSLSLGGEPLVLEGDEEKGFSQVEPPRGN